MRTHNDCLRVEIRNQNMYASVNSNSIIDKLNFES